MKEKKTESSGGTGSGSGEVKMIAIEEIKLHPVFSSLLPIDPALQERIAQSMRVEGFYLTEPLTLGRFPELEWPVVVDGHMGLRAALLAGITHVPCVETDFESLMAGAQRAVFLQTGRRPATDGGLYMLCEVIDKLKKRGGDRRSEKAKSKKNPVVSKPSPSTSAEEIAELLGCSPKKVEKMRKIRNEGTREIQRAVRTGKMSINSAYNRIRAMQKGKDISGKSSSATIKAAKILISVENFTDLKELGGDLGDHLNMAVAMYIRAVKKKEAH